MHNGNSHLKDALAPAKIADTGASLFLADTSDLPALSRHSWFRRTSNGKTYVFAKIGGRNVPMHVFLLGKRPGFVIDHANNDGTDNRRSNLRFCTQQQNMQNQSRHTDSRSPFKGIWRMKDCDRWAAQIRANGKRIYLGLFKDAADGARAYDAKARELFGSFAKCNFPEVSR